MYPSKKSRLLAAAITERNDARALARQSQEMVTLLKLALQECGGTTAAKVQSGRTTKRLSRCLMNDNNAMVPRSPQVNTFQEIMQIGQVIAQSAAFVGHSSALAVVKILAGRELGFPAIASVIGIHMIEGKPSIGSHLLAAAIRGSGRYDYEILEHTDQVCVVRFKRKLSDGTWKALEPVERLTLQEAVEKGWTVTTGGKLKPTWAKTPKNMLFARCISNGYKFHSPDLFSGLLVYDQDELEPSGGPVVDASYTVNGVHVGQNAPPTPDDPALQWQQEIPANPTTAPQADPERLTEQEYEQLVSLAKQHGRTQGDVKRILAVLGVPVLDRVPRSRLSWTQVALTLNLVPTAQVDQITKLVEQLKLDWNVVTSRLQQKYRVPSLGHLLPGQADELEQLLSNELKKRQAVQQLQRAVAS